jgi:hypothetical protein
MIIPNPELDGTVWGTSPLLRRGADGPDIRFLYCDSRYPKIPSHVWWDGIGFALDRNIFYSHPPAMELTSNDYGRFVLGPLKLILDDTCSMTLAELEAAERSAQADQSTERTS